MTAPAVFRFILQRFQFLMVFFAMEFAFDQLDVGISFPVIGVDQPLQFTVALFIFFIWVDVVVVVIKRQVKVFAQIQSRILTQIPQQVCIKRLGL